MNSFNHHRYESVAPKITLTFTTILDRLGRRGGLADLVLHQGLGVRLAGLDADSVLGDSVAAGCGGDGVVNDTLAFALALVLDRLDHDTHLQEEGGDWVSECS